MSQREIKNLVTIHIPNNSNKIHLMGRNDLKVLYNFYRGHIFGNVRHQRFLDTNQTKRQRFYYETQLTQNHRCNGVHHVLRRHLYR